jgi:predicted choloylglycine hydrolase
VDELSITFRAIAEPEPGERFQTRFGEAWPTYRRWYLRDGDGARPSYAEARRMLHEHMPELVPAWSRLVELAGGGDLAARMLALYDPPPLVSGCSQAVLGGGGASVLVRNYDFDPALLEGVIGLTALRGQGVIGMSDCLWGLLDGMNESGLAVSLAFGGRRATGAGFGVSLVLRYLLETCTTTAQAVRTLERLPVQGAYNLTLLDRSGEAATAYLAADRRPRRRARRRTTSARSNGRSTRARRARSSASAGCGRCSASARRPRSPRSSPRRCTRPPTPTASARSTPPSTGLPTEPSSTSGPAPPEPAMCG